MKASTAVLLATLLGGCSTTARHPGVPVTCSPSNIASVIARQDIPRSAKAEYLRRCGVSEREPPATDSTRVDTASAKK